MIDHCIKGRETPITQQMINQVLHRKRTNGEFKFNAHIGEYDVDNFILYLGLDVNVLPKQTWEMTGEPELIWSHVQLSLANWHKIVLIERLIGVPINIDRLRNMKNFEVIEIIDDSQPYTTLMGMEWVVDNQEIIKLKRRQMIFEVGDLMVTTPLEPLEGKRYTESVRENDMHNLYNITARMEDYVEPTMDGVLSWRIFSSCTSDSKSCLEN
jgi:hypothetical protein